MSLDPSLLGRTLQAHLAHTAITLAYHDQATGRTHDLHLRAAGQPDGLLPVFVVAGEAVWREATGKGLALDIRPDAQGLFGRRLHSVGSGTFSSVMLSMMEAVAQASGPERLLINDLRVQWAERLARIAPAPSGDPGPLG